MKKILFFMGIISMCLLYISCGKDDLNESNLHAVEIYLTDDPLDAEEVNIEILSVILVGEDESHQIELNTLSGIYNLLDFQGDIDTLIASGNYDLDNIKEIRLILGDNNTIKIDGQTFPMDIPSGSDSGLKIKINKELTGQSLISLLIDFDACKSVKEVNGSYKLSPVIHFKGDRNKKDLDLEDVIELDSCYTIEFPVSVKNTDGNEATVSTYEELIVLIQDGLITGIVYPFNVIDEEGKTHKVNNSNQAKQLLDECSEDNEGEAIDFAGLLDSVKVCFVFQYPVSIITTDGSIIEAMDDQELAGLTDVSDFVYPFYLVDNDGKEKKINNLPQLEAQLKNCDKGDNDFDFTGLVDSIKVCFVFQYPVSVITTDGSIIEAMDDQELAGLTDVSDFVYPFYLVDNDGKEKKINNLPQLEAQLKNCDKGDNDFDFTGLVDSIKVCFVFQYPVSVITNDSVIIDVMDDQELNGLTGVSDFIYPFYLINKEGEVKKINNIHQLEGQLRNCDDDDENNDDNDYFEDTIDDILNCFEIVFPIIVIDADSMELTIDSLEQLIEKIKNRNVISFASGFNVIDSEGNVLLIDSADDIVNLLKSCVADDYHNDIFDKIKSCIDFEFPLTVEKNGEKIVVNDLDELIALFESGENCKFVFPFNINEKQGMSGKNKKITNGNKLRKLLEDCE